jgi:hypothetical protein
MSKPASEKAAFAAIFRYHERQSFRLSCCELVSLAHFAGLSPAPQIPFLAVFEASRMSGRPTLNAQRPSGLIWVDLAILELLGPARVGIAPALDIDAAR